MVFGTHDMRPYLEGQLAHIIPRIPRGIDRLTMFWYPYSRMCNFLPLIRDSIYASTLTVYCFDTGIHGMKAHFPS